MSLPTPQLAINLSEVLGCLESFLHHAERASKLIYEDEAAYRSEYSPNPYQAGALRFIEELDKCSSDAIENCLKNSFD
jgi:hypothetical protein